ncbi:MAG TPA: urease accessory protein UreE [Alphaproteobacteria bacterium]|jgi:urease accessory protein|nr:urease accessory protein UreE [Alphaproteobacteria bacterium]|tara:strand:+ start:7287 stop:7739 length:453 start_codon:yes stop_codon:yes gene_type:complete
MQRAVHSAAAGTWPADAAAETAALDYEDRARRRIRLRCESGFVFLLDLPAVVRLRDGDGLKLDDGRWIGVRAAPEPLIEVPCADPEGLVRLAWHLGNRHVPTEVYAGTIRFRYDPVIVDMVKGLGARPVALEAPFQPEPGAYTHKGHSHG